MTDQLCQLVREMGLPCLVINRRQGEHIRAYSLPASLRATKNRGEGLTNESEVVQTYHCHVRVGVLGVLGRTVFWA